MTPSNEPTIETQVLIVGGGPVGLLGAQILGRCGIDTLVVEKHLQRLDAPKAHALNPRSLEICHAAGVPMAAIHAAATPAVEGGFVHMLTRLSDAPFGSLPYERQDDAVRRFTPWPLINIAQPRFEAIVEEQLEDAVAVTVRRGWEWQRCAFDTNGVRSTLIDRTNGATRHVRSRYLIAADGAGSSVRDAVGIPMDGPAELQHNMMIHFEADLEHLVVDKPGILYFLFGPQSSGALISYDRRRTWVLMHPYEPGRDATDSFTDVRCRSLVEAAIGTSIPSLRMCGARPWVMSAQVARRYRSGGAFLAGDAAHRFPPTGGLGLNTGIADIDNLCWKINAVIAGWAGEGILDSYELERRSVAQTNMSQSLGNALGFRAVFQALGYAPDLTVDAATFTARLHDPAARAAVDAAIVAQKDHFDSLRLQLGYVYGGDASAASTAPISDYTPQAIAGARLPHVWLADGRSILDTLHHDRFTLLAGAAGLDWEALTVSQPLSVLVEGRAFHCPDPTAIETLGLSGEGAVLVRPDGHILHVAASADVAARRSMTTALDTYSAMGVVNREGAT